MDKVKLHIKLRQNTFKNVCMNKQIILIILIVFSLLGCNNDQTNKLPEEYKKYNSLNSLNTKDTILFGNYYLRLLFKSSEPIEQALLPSNDLIVSTTTKKKNSDIVKHFYKLDKNGKIIDSISFIENFKNGKEELLHNYLVNKKQKYFTTWPLDGKRNKINFILQNENMNTDRNTEKKMIDEIFGKAQFSRVDYDFDHVFETKKNSQIEENKSDTDNQPIIVELNKTVYIIFYLMNGQWYNFYTLTDISKRVSLDEVLSSRVSSNTLFKKYDKNEQEWAVILNKNIIYKYFHKIKGGNVTISGGGGSSYSTYWWKGQLFSNLIINKDTLKVYDDLYLDEGINLKTPITINGKEIGHLIRGEKESVEPLMFYSNKALNYSLFTNDEKKVYMIKEKDSIK
jgi:uncharacterized lipoprotein NlpE involved in copper resistance